jgi:hypothetical protein
MRKQQEELEVKKVLMEEKALTRREMIERQREEKAKESEQVRLVQEERMRAAKEKNE